jgi:rSAM/selenodomain-associated transferase 1
MRRCLMIVVKEPVVGQVKTRLAASVGAAYALALYEAFVADTIAAARTVPDVDVGLVFWPPSAHAYFRTLYPHAVLFPQRGADLGERLLSGFEQAHAAGYERCVIMSSDSPNLPALYLRYAFEALERVPVVLGPCEDGGYYLIGGHTPEPALFQDIAWSTEVVYQQTVERTEGAGLELATLPPWYDIDTAADLNRLRTDLVNEPSTAPSATLAVLNRMLAAAAHLCRGVEAGHA